MSLVNLQDREISIKVVYYGPGLGGKTTSLQYIHRALKPDSRGQLVSLATGVDRTLYFDFLPVKLPKLRGFNVRVQLYTVPGQVHYNSTRKLVLNGCDGVVFVADSQRQRESANTESLDNLKENLKEQALTLDKIPFVLQYNKRDCGNVLTVDELNAALNAYKSPAFETIALSGKGVFESLKAITTAVLQELRRKGVWDPKPETRERSSSQMAALRDASHGVRDPMRDSSASLPAIGGGLSDRIMEFAERENSEVGMRNLSGMRPLPSPAAAGSLAELLMGAGRDQAIAVEQDIVRGDYSGAVGRVGQYVSKVSVEAAGSDPDGGPAVVALLYRLAPDRYLRMRELLRRAESGAVSSQDATFALFFLVDLELARTQPRG